MALKTSNSEKLFIDFAEKLAIAKKVCDTYSGGKYTIESVCLNHGVPYRTFMQWVSDVPEVAGLYKGSKGKKKDKRKGELLELAETALQKRLQGWPTEETIVEGGLDEKGEMKRKRMRKTRKIVPPDSTLIIFALKISNPKKYIESNLEVEGDGKETMYDFSKLTPDEIKVFERIVDKLGK